MRRVWLLPGGLGSSLCTDEQPTNQIDLSEASELLAAEQQQRRAAIQLSDVNCRISAIKAVDVNKTTTTTTTPQPQPQLNRSYLQAFTNIVLHPKMNYAERTRSATQTGTGMRAHAPLMRMEISLLPLLPVSLPPAVTQCKKFEALSFILVQSWALPCCQAIKHEVSPYHPLFSSSHLAISLSPHPLVLFKSLHLNLHPWKTARDGVSSSEYMGTGFPETFPTTFGSACSESEFSKINWNSNISILSLCLC